jgi:hypothetical protein
MRAGRAAVPVRRGKNNIYYKSKQSVTTKQESLLFKSTDRQKTLAAHICSRALSSLRLNKKHDV